MICAFIIQRLREKETESERKKLDDELIKSSNCNHGEAFLLLLRFAVFGFSLLLLLNESKSLTKEDLTCMSVRVLLFVFTHHRHFCLGGCYC